MRNQCWRNGFFSCFVGRSSLFYFLTSTTPTIVLLKKWSQGILGLSILICRIQRTSMSMYRFVIDTKRMVDTSFEVYVVVLCTIFCRHWLGYSSRHEDLSDMVCQSEIEPLFVDWFLSSKIFHVYRTPWTTRLLWRSSGYNTLWCFQYCTDCRDSIIVVPSLMLYDTPVVTRWLRSKKI